MLLFHFDPELLDRPETAANKALEPYRADFFLPPRADLEAALYASYHASQTQDEGRRTEFRLGFASLDTAVSSTWPVVSFAEPAKLTTDAIRRLAPVAQARRAYLGVEPGPEGLSIWGTFEYPEPEVGDVRFLGLTIVASGPGRLAVLAGLKELVVIEPDHVRDLSDTPPLDAAQAELGLHFHQLLSDGEGDPYHAVVMLEVARALRRHGHGGALLVVNRSAGGDGLAGAPIESMELVGEAGRGLLRDATSRHQELTSGVPAGRDVGTPEMRQALQRDATRSFRTAIRQTARLGLVDGAILLSAGLELIGFAVFITSADLSDLTVTVMDPLDGWSRTPKEPKKLGGSRHQSALSFVNRYPGEAVAIVASQDGVLTLIGKTTDEGLFVVKPMLREVS